MSNPYVPPSLTGYNANPPVNDGTEEVANQLDWDKHIDKIGDPLKNYVQAVSGAITSAFDVAFGNSIKTISGNYTVVTGDRGVIILQDREDFDTTITLPTASSAGSGFVVGLVNIGNSKVTINPAGSETINARSSIALLPNDFVNINSNGGAWAAEGTFSVIGSFTPSHVGFSSAPAGDYDYIVRGNTVQLAIPTGTGTSNGGSWTITNPPDEASPNVGVEVPIATLVDNGSEGWGSFSVSSGQMAFHFQGGGFTASGNKGISAHASVAAIVVTYPLRVS